MAEGVQALVCTPGIMSHDDTTTKAMTRMGVCTPVPGWGENACESLVETRSEKSQKEVKTLKS